MQQRPHRRAGRHRRRLLRAAARLHASACWLPRRAATSLRPRRRRSNGSSNRMSADGNPMKRVLIAGFQHETNTFAPTTADWAAFNRGETFPAFIDTATRWSSADGRRQHRRSAASSTRRASAAGARALVLGRRDAVGARHRGRVRAHRRRASSTTCSGARQRRRRRGLPRPARRGGRRASRRPRGRAAGAHPRAGRAARSRSSPASTCMPTSRSRCSTMADALVAYRTYPHVDMADTGARWRRRCWSAAWRAARASRCSAAAALPAAAERADAR